MNEHPQNGMGGSRDGQGEEGAADADGPGWRDTGEEFESLRDSFRRSYREGAAEGPSRDEVVEAFRTLGGAITQMVAGAEATLKDPEVKEQVQKTTRTVITAVTGALSEWVSELRRRLEERRRRQAGSAPGDDDGGSRSEPDGDESPGG